MDYINLIDVCYTIGKGKNIISKDDGNIYAVGFPNITLGRVSLSSANKCDLRNEYEDLKMYNVEKMDIILPLITRKNILLKQIESVNKQIKMIYSARAIYIRVDPNKYVPEFLFHLLSNEKYRKKLIDEAYTESSYTGTYQISLERLKQVKIPVVSIAEQTKVLEEERKISKEIESLIEQKDLLYKNY